MAKATTPEIPTIQMVDDYKVINGIGPAVERRLHDAGITSYAQLASLKPKVLAKILDGLVGYSVERIIERDFIGQAKRLADEASQVPVVELADKPRNNSLHYASYTVELLLDMDNNVRRTRVMHVQSRAESSWAGWDQEKLRAFLVESGQLKDLQLTAEINSATDFLRRGTPQPEKLSPKQGTSRPELHLAGSARVAEAHFQSPEGKTLGALIPSGQPFVLRMELDLSQVESTNGDKLAFDANLYTKRIGKGEQDLIGSVEGILPPGERAMIDIKSQPLPPGDYRLEALVAVRHQSQHKKLKHQLMAISEGMRIHVF